MFSKLCYVSTSVHGHQHPEQQHPRLNHRSTCFKTGTYQRKVSQIHGEANSQASHVLQVFSLNPRVHDVDTCATIF